MTNEIDERSEVKSNGLTHWIMSDTVFYIMLSVVLGCLIYSFSTLFLKIASLRSENLDKSSATKCEITIFRGTGEHLEKDDG